MYVEAQLLTKEQACERVAAFAKRNADAFYYVEAVTHYALQPVAQLTELPDFQFIRLFSQQADLQVRRLQSGYQLVQLNANTSPTALQFVRERELLLDGNYVGSYKKLVVAEYVHEELGMFTHWKEVQR